MNETFLVVATIPIVIFGMRIFSDMYSDRQKRLTEESKNRVREKELELEILEKKQRNAPKYVRPEQASYQYQDGLQQEQ